MAGGLGQSFGQQAGAGQYADAPPDRPAESFLAAPWPADPFSSGQPTGQPPEANLDSQTGLAEPELATRVLDLEAALARIHDQAQSNKENPPEKMSINIRGHLMLDAASFSQDALDKLRYDEQNGLAYRVGRLIVEGRGADVMSYKAEFEFARLSVEDLWIGIGELPLLGNLRIGQMKEPFSLEQIPSRKYHPFLEFSLAETIHTPPRRVGIMAFDSAANERRTWAVGLFSEARGLIVVQDDDFGGALTMRGTWLPWYDEATQGRGLLHLGLAYSHRECFRSTARFRARPESFLASYALDTGNLPADSVDLLGTELAFVYGPLSAQSEYILGLIDPIAAPGASIQGVYVFLSWFLTGESRNYLKSQGIFGQVRPLENFFRVRTPDGTIRTGKGAWELKYRYSYLDALDRGRLAAGRIGNHAVGVNWYLNRFSRVMAEYVFSTIDRPGTDRAGHLHIFQMRSQIEY